MKDFETMTEVVLPHQTHETFLTDGGLETALIFLDGIDLPQFASFPLVDEIEGREALKRYYRGFMDIAKASGTRFVLETPTWRAGPEWGATLGFGPAEMIRFNKASVGLIREIAAEPAYVGLPLVLNGVIGPRGDGYVVGTEMTVEEARAYHALQIGALADAGVHMVSAVTMTYVQEAIGIALAARDAGVSAVVSFTVETDGRLPSGQALGEAIRQVDEATANEPIYYMVNCAHPDHFQHVLETDGDWISRIRAVRANASRMSHAELDEAEELDPGNPEELAQQYGELRALLPNLNVMGGCCGTDHRHIGAIAHHNCTH